MKINKNSWHYRVRKNWEDFVSLNAGRKINLDFKDLTRTQYIIDVFLGYYITIISPISDLLLFILRKTGLANLLYFIVTKIKKRKKEYVTFV